MTGAAESSSLPQRDGRKSSFKMNNLRDDTADKYGKLYEENMNPFVQFHKRVSRQLALLGNACPKALVCLPGRDTSL